MCDEEIVKAKENSVLTFTNDRWIMSCLMGNLVARWDLVFFPAVEAPSLDLKCVLAVPTQQYLVICNLHLPHGAVVEGIDCMKK